MWLRHTRLMEGADDGSGGDGSSGGGGGEGGVSDVQKTVGELAQQVGVLTKAMSVLAQGNQEMQSSIRALSENIGQGFSSIRKPDGEGDKAPPNGNLFEGVDLEQLDRNQFGTMILSKFMERLDAHMEGKLKPFEQKIGQIESTVVQDLGRRNIADVSSANKDLYEWKDEIAVILKESPQLSLARALAIARAENPDKNAAMQKKYASSGGDGDRQKLAFLGLTPTSRSGPSDGKGGKMKLSEAAERAFDDVVASFGGQSFDQLTLRQ